MWDQLFGDLPPGLWPALQHVVWRVDYASPLATGYSILNLLEAIAWFAVAAWVLRRHFKRDTGGAWDYAYFALFVVFGLSDVMESQLVPLWLIAAKGAIFIAILLVRWIVVRRYYPGAKM